MNDSTDIRTADAPHVCIFGTDYPGSLPRLFRRFRSAASGLWYENPRAAGTINAVELDGHILERKDGEQSMPWIRRAAEWASAIHSANARISDAPGETSR